MAGKDRILEVLQLLKSNAYWQHSLTIESLALMVRSSHCFLAIRDNIVIAFARVLTDDNTWGSLWDVVVDEPHRKTGIGFALLNEIFSYPLFYKIKNWVLFTENAQGLYRKFGFNSINQVISNAHSSQYIIII